MDDSTGRVRQRKLFWLAESIRHIPDPRLKRATIRLLLAELRAYLREGMKP